MAEKKERILCIETYEKIAECGYGDFYNTITRQEAIERIAKALIRADYPNAQESILAMRWNNPASKDYYLIMAEAALNALLKGE